MNRKRGGGREGGGRGEARASPLMSTLLIMLYLEPPFTYLKDSENTQSNQTVRIMAAVTEVVPPFNFRNGRYSLNVKIGMYILSCVEFWRIRQNDRRQRYVTNVDLV